MLDLPADIYRMRHVVHMPHLIYVSAISQTNTNKTYAENNKSLKTTTTAITICNCCGGWECRLGLSMQDAFEIQTEKRMRHATVLITSIFAQQARKQPHFEIERNRERERYI